jgi:hypothetical protein
MTTNDVVVTLDDGSQVHVQIEADTPLPVTVSHVAQRPYPSATWGPPLGRSEYEVRT